MGNRVIEVEKDGIIYRCRTVDEAAELGMRLSGIRVRGRRTQSASSPTEPTEIFQNGGLKLLEALNDAPDGLTSSEIAAKLGIGMQSIPPLILGLKRKARAHGIDLDEFVVREKSYQEGKPISRYRLTETGRKQLAQSGRAKAG